MYCTKCGNQIDDDAKFCSKCGSNTAINSEVKKNIKSKQSPNISAPKNNYEVVLSEADSKKNSDSTKRSGILWLVIPACGLFVVLALFAVSVFIFESIGGGTSEMNVMFSVIQVMLGFLGIIFISGLIIGVPVGILFINKAKNHKFVRYDSRSGAGKNSEIPSEIKGWNWGAAGLSGVWGIYHGVWMVFLQFIPGLNLVFWILLGMYGSEWAWKKQKWESVESFNSAQKKWSTWGIIFFILSILIGLLSGLITD